MIKRKRTRIIMTGVGILIVVVCLLIFIISQRKGSHTTFGIYDLKVEAAEHSPVTGMGYVELSIKNNEWGLEKLFSTSNDINEDKNQTIIPDKYTLELVRGKAAPIYEAYEYDYKEDTQYIRVAYIATEKAGTQEPVKLKIVKTADKKVKKEIPIVTEENKESRKIKAAGLKSRALLTPFGFKVSLKELGKSAAERDIANMVLSYKDGTSVKIKVLEGLNNEGYVRVVDGMGYYVSMFPLWDEMEQIAFVNLQQKAQEEARGADASTSRMFRGKIVWEVPTPENSKACKIRSASTHNMAVSKGKLYFSALEDRVVYCVDTNKNGEVIQAVQGEVYAMKANGDDVYMLTREKMLVHYSTTKYAVLSQVDVGALLGSTAGTDIQLSAVDDTGVYITKVNLEGTKAAIYHVDKNGKAESIREFSEGQIPRPALVQDGKLYYDLNAKNDSDSGVYALDIKKDKTVKLSDQIGIGQENSCAEYYLWNNKLVFPLADKETLCMVKTDGSDEQTYPFNSGNSYILVGDSIYSTDTTLYRFQLNTGEFGVAGSPGDDFTGQLYAVEGKLVLSRYESDSQDMASWQERRIYIWEE